MGGRTPRKYRPGERVEARVVAIGRESVFADLGAKQEALFERTELLNDEGDLSIKIGDVVAAVVQGFADGQVQLAPLSVRSGDTIPDLEGNPYEAFLGGAAKASKPLLVEGARVTGKVVKIEKFGVFVQIDGTQGRGGQGLVPAAETQTPRNADLRKHFEVGGSVEAKILTIDETGRIRLSIKALSEDAERADYKKYASQKQQSESSFSRTGNLGTLGDKLGALASSVSSADPPGGPRQPLRPRPSARRVVDQKPPKKR